MMNMEDFEDNAELEQLAPVLQSKHSLSTVKKRVLIAFSTLVVVALVVGLFVALFRSEIPSSAKNDSPNKEPAKEHPTRSVGQSYLNHTVGIINNCSYPVWVGVLGNPNYPLPFNGGWRMNSSEEVTLELDHGWSGRFWGRTNCDQWGWCETGDCGGKIECAGAGGIPPATLVEFSFDTPGGDYYDVSLVDGYNIPMGIMPRNATRSPFGGDWRYHCQYAGCNVGEDLNDICPPELQLNSSGQVIACMSACWKFNEDQYCCRGNYSTPATCPPTQYTRIFKEVCPEAYSYAYDDDSALYTCDGIPVSDYDVIFCP